MDTKLQNVSGADIIKGVLAETMKRGNESEEDCDHRG